LHQEEKLSPHKVCSVSAEEPKINPKWTFPPQEMHGRSTLEHGTGSKYHQFSTETFSPEKANDYMAQTGLNEDTGVTQNWGGATNGNVYRSRRGSIGGFAPAGAGENVAMWRLSSYATTRALGQPTASSDTAYRSAADALQSKAENSAQTATSANTVLSDFGQVHFDPSAKGFKLFRATHAQGVSGVGLTGAVSNETKEHYYQPSMSSIGSDGVGVRPEQAYHSEPMAITFHNQVRAAAYDLPSLGDTENMVGIMESFPNQVCKPCGRMLSREVGPRGYVSGNPGVDFGGQHSGALGASDVSGGKATVHKTQPMEHLSKDVSNLSEVRAIHTYHGAKK
jgi:hypothetical protein